MLSRVLYSHEPVSFDEVWLGTDQNGKECEVFNKDNYESVDDAQSHYHDELVNYELEEEYMSEHCKYILYDNYIYPARYNINTKTFQGLGLINNMQFTKKEILYWSDDNYAIHADFKY